ncbi:MAG TPA: bifunctional diguanylate cyclase/phosphodiesterase [Steroidobacteraceae bacterium]|jgi:diguanylate cyclase (GGDEF)-like protein
MFASYAQLACQLLQGVTGICLLDGRLALRGQSGSVDLEATTQSLRALGWNGSAQRSATAIAQSGGSWLTAIPLEQNGALLGVFCLYQPQADAEASALRLKPLLECVNRELAAMQPASQRMQSLTERSAELEWLFKLTSSLKGASDDRRILEELLSAATARLDSTFGILIVPEKRICVEHDLSGSNSLRDACRQTQQHLITWAQRQNRPLIVNGPGGNGKPRGRAAPPARCKILSVPVVRDTGAVIGVLAFFNPPTASDYAARHVFLARHLGRQTAAIVETQFDLMTGLHTRDGLEQMYGRLVSDTEAPICSVIYVDVDHMHVVNELHGFELGNELIVRIADLMAPPLLPAGALAARIAGDRFAIILSDTDTHAAASTAAQLQAAAAAVTIGPAQETIDVSVSCGVAALVSMPQGLARALAAAELACKSAKKHGRNRVELYACEDNSMMRRHEDVVAVGQLRSAFKTDRLLLYAQRIVPLQNPDLPSSFEILLRLRGPNGDIIAPGSLINAAQRYQLLPSVDRWVAERALQTLSPYRNMLKSRGISVSINVSGQSIGDEAFIRRFTDQLKAAGLPHGCITVEITEQAAVTNLARANDMIQQLNAMGCRLALDDFGTGSNSLTNLKSLDIARVKIDGSFVRDIVTDQRSQVTVRAIVELAKGFSIDTVAEFVENKAIADAVRKLGVDYAQGYAFGKPEPLKDILESLNREESQRLHKLFMEM